MQNPYTEEYIREHMEDFYAFVHAVNDVYGCRMDGHTLAILHIDMKRDK